jgi:hypothetical protein
LAELLPVEEFLARRELVVSNLPIFLDVELLSVDVISLNTFGGSAVHLEHVDDLSNVKLTQLDHFLAGLGVNLDGFVFRNQLDPLHYILHARFLEFEVVAVIHQRD